MTRKSYEGVAFFFLVAWLTATFMLLHFSSTPRESVLLLSLTVALIGAAIEAESWRGWDNLFVPLGIYLFLARYIDAGPHAVLLATGYLMVALFLAFRVLPEFGVDRHAALAATLIVFVIWIEAGRLNVAAPIAAILCHFAAAARSPCEDGFPRLSALAGTVVMALAWFGLNKLTAFNTSFLFNLSFAAFGAMGLGLAFGRRPALLIAGVIALWALAQIRVFGVAPVTPLKFAFSAAALALIAASAWGALLLQPSLARRRYLKLVPAAMVMAAVAFPVAEP